MFAKLYKYWQMKERKEAHVCSGKWGGGGVNAQKLRVRSINISSTKQYYMERKIKIFVHKYVKIKLIRGKGQKTHECLQREWLESKCSRKCSPTAHCIVEGPQKLAKIRRRARKSTHVLKSIHSQHITLLRTQKIGENVYDRLQMDHENVR